MAEDEEVVFTTSTGPVRVITAASLFDGHDAAINVMRRLIQSSGAEVIHLGHDQSAKAVVDCAIQEDAHAVALTSYQGGHWSTSPTFASCSTKLVASTFASLEAVAGPSRRPKFAPSISRASRKSTRLTTAARWA